MEPLSCKKCIFYDESYCSILDVPTSPDSHTCASFSEDEEEEQEYISWV